MKLNQILAQKGKAVFTICPDATLAEAVQAMAQHHCGSLVVCDRGTMVGIVSERDILRGLAAETRSLSESFVYERMNHQVVTASPTDEIAEIMGQMTQHHIRHLPVIDQGQLIGLVSMGDLVKAQYHELSKENHFLMSYIQS